MQLLSDIISISKFSKGHNSKKHVGGVWCSCSLHIVVGGRVVRWSWVKLPVPGRPTIWMIVGQGPIALGVGAGGGVCTFLPLLPVFSSLSFPPVRRTDID